MPFLSTLREVTIPVPIQRGSVSFNLDVALEKFTPEEGKYRQLREEAVEIQFRLAQLRQGLNDVLGGIVALSDLGALRAELEAEQLETLRGQLKTDTKLDSKARNAASKRLPAKARDAVTDEAVKTAFETRLKEAEAKADAIRLQIDGDPKKAVFGLKNEEHKNVAARLAYLVAGSDITDADGAPVLSGAVDKTDAEFEGDTLVFFQNFSVKLLNHCLEKAEEAVYGPLETAGSIAN